MKNKTEEKPVIIAKGKLVASGRPFQLILINGVKKFVWGENCIKLFIILCVVLMSSCEVFNPEVDDELKPYVDSFFEEARIRGKKIHRPSILTVKFKDVRGNAQGKCIHALNAVYIDKNSFGWQTNPEALVFHELGHLFLKRGHKNTSKNGFCVSIMSQDDDPIYDMYPGDRLYDRREYYINELFKINVDTPEFLR